MRVVGLPSAFYYLSRHRPIALSPKAQERLRWLRCFEALRKQGLPGLPSLDPVGSGTGHASPSWYDLGQGAGGMRMHDAATLAHLLRLNYLPTAYIPPREVRDLREILRHRARLVKTQTMVKNRIHAILAKNGIRHKFSDLFSHGIL